MRLSIKAESLLRYIKGTSEIGGSVTLFILREYADELEENGIITIEDACGVSYTPKLTTDTTNQHNT